MKNLLILGASHLQIPLIKRAKELGHTTIVVDMNISAPGAKIADHFFQVSTIDSEEVLKIAYKFNITGILTTSDLPVSVVAYVCDKLKLFGPSIEAASICSNKFLQRDLLEREGFYTPPYKLVKNKEDLKKIYDWDFPVIIKPVDSSASRGVQKVLNAQELDSAYELAKSNSKSGNVIVEGFVEGDEYSAEVLVQDKRVHIIAITEKITSGFNNLFFVEEIHIVPANLSEEKLNTIKVAVIRFLHAIGLNNSAAHVEIKLKKDVAFIIEAAARLGGDFITSDLVPLATGVDMTNAIIDLSLGLKININQNEKQFAAIHFFTPDNILMAKKHIQELDNSKDIVRIEFDDQKEAKHLMSSFDRLGYLIAKADCRNKLEKLITFKGI